MSESPELPDFETLALPDLGYLRQQLMADVLGISATHLKRLASEGKIPAAERGRGKGYPVAECVWSYLRVLRVQKSPTGSHAEVRKELDEAKRDLARLEFETKSGQQVAEGDVIEAIQAASAVLVNRLEGMGGRLAHELAGISEPGAIRRRLLDEQRAVRTAASRELLELGGARLGGSDTAATEAHT